MAAQTAGATRRGQARRSTPQKATALVHRQKMAKSCQRQGRLPSSGAVTWKIRPQYGRFVAKYRLSPAGPYW